jgi:uncharacterized protein (DUF2249 family)
MKQTTTNPQPAPTTAEQKVNVVILDVREDLQKGREPFSKIMSTVASLGDDDQLFLIAPFEPTPLFRILGGQGFRHTVRTTEDGYCEVLFSREPQTSAAGGTEAQPCGNSEDSSRRPLQNQPLQSRPAQSPPLQNPEEVEVDARGLEPPQPLVKILEAVAILPEGARLRARTDRRPMHLYSRLEERGFVSETKEESDGSFITFISRR